MTLLLCFGPLLVFAIGAVLAFGIDHMNYVRRIKRERSIPAGKWYVSYRNHDYI